MVEFDGAMDEEGVKLLELFHDLAEIRCDVERINDAIRHATYSIEWYKNAEELDKRIVGKYTEVAELKGIVVAVNQASNFVRGNSCDGYDDFLRLKKHLELDRWGLLAKALKSKGKIKEIGEIILKVS